MNPKFIKKRIVVIALVSAILAPTAQAVAAEAASILGMANQNREVTFNQNALINASEDMSGNTNLEETLKIESSEEVRLNKILSEKIFAVVGKEGYLLINAQADENSAHVGKLYEDSVIKVVERTEEWTEISTGNLVGFIKTENLISGKAAIKKAKEILSAQYQDVEISTLSEEEIENTFSVGETAAEEAARLAAEEAARVAAEAERLAAEEAARAAESLAKGQAVVDYGKQFIGNPYVYGGTSLTRGTDCSGFVRGVYANFGISLPRTSYSMRSVGREVSYSEIQPGDIVCYPGHVGIYAGNGQIVNAIGDAEGIGMSNVRYTRIVTIRRVY